MSYHVQLFCQLSNYRGSSVQMLGGAVLDHFQAMPGVTISVRHPNDFPQPADVSIVHAYFSNACYRDNLQHIRRNSGKLIGFMETCGPEIAKTFDRFYYYGDLRNDLGEWSETAVHTPPLADLRAYTSRCSGTGGRVLLDHTPFAFRGYYSAPNVDWTLRLWDYFSRHRNKSVGQLARLDDGCHPDWVEVIPMLAFDKYLERMAAFDTFVCTCQNSFNHSAIDAAMLGLRVIVPKEFGIYCLPRSSIEHMGMTVIRSPEDLEAVLEEPFDHTPRYDRVLDVGAMVKDIDKFVRGTPGYMA